MSVPPAPPLLDEVLRQVARRYRLPATAGAWDRLPDANPATTLALVIERAREAVICGEAPGAALKRIFIDALAQMIRESLRVKLGDPVFQAMALRHREPSVREYASLSAHANQDRREVHAAVNAIAHPAKLQRALPGRQLETLSQLHESASSASWAELHDSAQRLFETTSISSDSLIKRGLARLLESPALERLQRLDALVLNELVRQYRTLWDQNGSRSGSPTALEQGSVSQQRGAAVEALAAQALQSLAEHLNAATGSWTSYRVVTSMRVPASIHGDHQRAKTEWDSVLLQQAQSVDGTPTWNVSLLLEAKASVDAATTDFRTLLRGLRLLACAEENSIYPFKTRQGIVHLRGASLRTLSTDNADLARSVLYCCDAPVESSQRLLSAASRMQLLSAQASLEFATMLAENQSADPHGLESVWHQLLESPRCRVVLNQLPLLRNVRELMAHTEDLLVAINSAAEHRNFAG